MIDNHNQQSLALYQGLLEAGVAKECARDVLPTNAKTRLYMSGTIRSWLHFIDLRGANGTQAEHRQIALQIGEILETELPTVARAMWG
jgi:thymidylate synthase (FAD)